MKFVLYSKKRQIWTIAGLLLPLALAVLALIWIKVNAAIVSDELLSPADNKPLLVSLIIFIFGYMIFLLMLFSENIFDFFKQRH